MSVRRNVLLGLFAAGAAALTAMGGGAPAESPGFQSIEHEGRLLENGVPVNRVVDLEFGVFDTAAGGNQVGPTLFAEGVVVEDGYFLVTLEFGEFEFNASKHWLEMGVDGVTMPRERLVSTFDLDQMATGAEVTGETVGGTSDANLNVASGAIGRAGARGDHTPVGPLQGGYAASSDPDEDEDYFWAIDHDGGGGEDGGNGIWNTNGNKYYYNGLVGIGTSNPQHTLHVKSSRAKAVIVDNTSSSGTRFGV